MNEDNKKAVVKYQIEKARKTFDEIEFLIENRFFTNAINRLYYSCYYAVGALLVEKDIKAKSHKGAIQMFGLHILETGIIEKVTGKIFAEIFELRQDSDYGNFFVVEERQVVELIEPANKLISQIELLLSVNV